MIEDYINEVRLGEFLTERVSTDFIHNKAFPGHKFRPDYRSETLKLIVEFDGYQHYQSSKRVVADEINYDICVQSGYTVIRLPYFIQLDSTVISLLFPWISDKSSYTSYPHGFHDKNALLPADFCSIGLERFMIDCDIFNCVSDQIYQSLRSKSGDPRTIMPNYFFSILSVN